MWLSRRRTGFEVAESIQRLRPVRPRLRSAGAAMLVTMAAATFASVRTAQGTILCERCEVQGARLRGCAACSAVAATEAIFGWATSGGCEPR